jgi:hypothetical protein
MGQLSATRSITPAEFQPRLERWHNFMAGSGSTQSLPYLFHVNFPLPEWEAKLPPATLAWPDKVQERIARNWADYELLLHKAALVDDDRIPYTSNMTGTEIFAEAFGCPVFRPSDNNPFALPFIHSAAEADRLRQPELSTSSLAYLLDIADELHRRGGPGVLMKPVDIQSPMDIVALIWEKSDLYIAMLETPEAVKALAEKVRGLLTDFFDEWFRRYGTTFVAHYPDYVMFGGISMSVDEVGAVNREMFAEFFEDELIQLSQHFGGLGIHCCADARHQWASFRSLPGLRLINHNLPPTRDPHEYILDSLAFYGNRVAQMPVGWIPDGPPETWPAQFPPGTRVVFEVQAEDAGQAVMIAEELQRVRGNHSDTKDTKDF